MKLGKALKITLSRWQITPYRLAKESNVTQSKIGKLISGVQESASWDVVERLAEGFNEIDPVAKATFYATLFCEEEEC